MRLETGFLHHNAALGTTPVLVFGAPATRCAGMVGMKAKLSNAAGGNLLVIGVPNNGAQGTTSAPTLGTGTAWDEASPGQTIQGGLEYGDPSKDYWFCLTAGTGEVSIWPLSNQ